MYSGYARDGVTCTDIDEGTDETTTVMLMHLAPTLMVDSLVLVTVDILEMARPVLTTMSVIYHQIIAMTNQHVPMFLVH